MSGRDEGYYGPSPSELGIGALVLMALGVAGVVLLVTLVWLGLSDGGDDGASGASVGIDAVSGRRAALEEENSLDAGGGFVLDACDRAGMHAAWLPAKSDVLSWHMNGRWGFSYDDPDDGYTVVAFYELPGGAWVWDALYGIDPDTPAFRFRGDSHDED